MNEDKKTLTNGVIEDDGELTPGALAAYEKLARARNIRTYKLETLPISGVGENSYGQVLQVKMTPTATVISSDDQHVAPFFSVIKMAPKQLNRRKFTRVVDYYKREVFIYEHVLRAFAEIKQAYALSAEVRFDQPPEMFAYSLETLDEFIIFEDLQQQRYQQNPRFNTPNFNLVEKALISLARLHAMSFVLQAMRPEQFRAWVQPMEDNLFANMLPFCVEFGKRHIDCTREVMKTERAKKKVLEMEIKGMEQQQQQQRHQLARRRGSVVNAKLVKLLNVVYKDFERICLRCVDGQACAPYAVICHGDFWNNNIMYHFDDSKQATSAKLIDFQMSRYASPVLDVVHFLFSCTEKELRDRHFQEFLNIYYQTLTQHLQSFNLNADKIYPRRIFEQHLCYYGVYGFCMSAFCVPFFISNASETVDFDEISTWAAKISDKPSSSSPVVSEDEIMTSDSEAEHYTNGEATEDTEEERICRQKLYDFQVLTERTLPIFKKRMFGIVVDLVQYDLIDMVEEISKEG